MGSEEEKTRRFDLVKKVIRKDFNDLDPNLHQYLQLLSSKGADECWHKHGTFFEHLFQVWKILFLWGQPQEVARLGLFHSSYSNSYVNLAIFNRFDERDLLRELLGNDAEELVYLFCVVNRQTLIFDVILPMGKIPEEGMTVKHIHTGEDIYLTPQVIAIFVISTIADFGDQRFDWQDELFSNNEGKMEFIQEIENPSIIWPGLGKPGLWMTFANKLARIIHNSNIPNIVTPPIFNYCQDILTEEQEKKARDLYWETITEYRDRKNFDKAKENLLESCRSNPFIAEPHILLAQIYMVESDWEKAIEHATKAKEILTDWATNYDKRVSWEAWISWTRVIIVNAKEQKWPTTSFGILSLGLVR